MSQLIVIGYPDSAAAERARDELFSLSRALSEHADSAEDSISAEDSHILRAFIGLERFFEETGGDHSAVEGYSREGREGDRGRDVASSGRRAI